MPLAESTSDTQPRNSRRRKAARRIMIYLLVALTLYVGFVLLAQRWVLFPRFAVGAPPPGVPRLAHERLEMDTPAGTVEAIFRRGQGVSEDNPGPLVIFAHGNAELIEHNADAMEPYVEAGFSVLLPEYRGYGQSAGSPSQRAIVRDFLAWRERVLQRPDVDADRLVYHGRSLGGGVVAQLAQRHPPRGLILESTFTSIKAMAGKYLVPALLVRDPFDTLRVVRAYEDPVLILHGVDDVAIPVQHAERLANAAPDAELVTHPGGHNDPPPPQPYWSAIFSYLEKLTLDTAEPGETPRRR
ncbi:MAG: alpha/beta hydrolase [Phycisphaeraceae bacterium]